MKIAKEIKVGITALFAITLLVWGYNFLKGTNLLFKSTTVYTQYPRVPGLSVSAPVIINGVQSGVVDDIYFKNGNSNMVIVRLSITETELFIPRNSIAELISTDFLGAKAIGIKLGDSQVNIKGGDTLTSYFEKSMLEDFSEQMLPIKEKAEKLMISMDTAIIGFNKTINNFNDMFNERNKRNLSTALSNLKTTIESFDVLAKNLNSTINTSVKPTMRKFGNVADSLKALELNETLLKAQNALDAMTAVMNKMNKGDGTVGKLMNNDSLYNNLNGATREMEELLEDMKLNPKRYFNIFRKKSVPFGTSPPKKNN